MALRLFDGAFSDGSAISGVRLQQTLDQPWPICLDCTCESLCKVSTVDGVEFRLVCPLRQLFFPDKPAVPVSESTDAYVHPYARERPIHRIVSQREPCARTCEDHVTARSHYSREFAQARPRIGNVFNHLETACDIEPPISERQPLGIRDDIFCIRQLLIQRASVRDITLVEVACDQTARGFAEFAVNLSFATTDVDNAPDLASASDMIQRPQQPALSRAVSWKEELVVHQASPS